LTIIANDRLKMLLKIYTQNLGYEPTYALKKQIQLQVQSTT